MRKLFWRCAVLCIVSLCISCKTAPQFPDPVAGETASIPLEPGALVYVFADVQGARPILDLVPLPGLNEKRAREMLDRTRSAAAALYPAESGRRFQLTAWGSYPNTGAAVAFGADKNWKKRRSAGGLPYWYSARDQLSAALSAGQAFVAASLDDTPLEPFSAPPGIEAPDGFAEFRRGAVLSCWLENPGALVSRVLAATGIPLQLPAERIFVSVFRAARQGGGEAAEAERYEALLGLQFASASQARSVLALFTLARALLPANSPAATGSSASGPAALAGPLALLLFANPPVQNGDSLTIKTAALTETEIALLFALFSVYFA